MDNYYLTRPLRAYIPSLSDQRRFRVLAILAAGEARRPGFRASFERTVEVMETDGPLSPAEMLQLAELDFATLP